MMFQMTCLLGGINFFSLFKYVAKNIPNKVLLNLREFIRCCCCFFLLFFVFWLRVFFSLVPSQTFNKCLLFVVKYWWQIFLLPTLFTTDPSILTILPWVTQFKLQSHDLTIFRVNLTTFSLFINLTISVSSLIVSV